MKRLILLSFACFHLFSAHTQKIIKPISPSVKQPKKQATSSSKPQQHKAPTQTPAFKELELVLVKGQLFTMGDVFEKDIKNQNPPIHNETVNDFYIAKYEVSQWLWSTIMDKNPAYNFRYQCPVERVSYEDIQIFIQKLNEMTGRKFRLPTEIEWEYAAREEGKEVLYGNGKMEADALKINFMGIENTPLKSVISSDITPQYNSPYNEQSQYLPNDIKMTTTPMRNSISYIKTGIYRQETTLKGSFSPNKLGLYDMAGNVAEWCSTCGTKEELHIGNGSNETKFVCIVRGGNWYSTAEKCTTFYRSFAEPTVKDSGIGFRLAEDAD